MANKPGIIFLAPGQRPEVIKGIEKTGKTVVVLSSLDVDGEFGTPVGKKVKFELKNIPDDLVSSLHQSARFSRQAIELGSNEGPSIYMMIGYPDFKWRFNRETGKRVFMMMDGVHETGLSYDEYQGRMLTMAMIGILPMHVPTWGEVGESLGEIYEQFQMEEHRSHLARPKGWAGSGLVRGWDKPSPADIISHIYQGFENVSTVKGMAMWQYFGNFRTLALGQEKHFREVPGMGAKTAKDMMRQLDAEFLDYMEPVPGDKNGKWQPKRKDWIV